MKMFMPHILGQIWEKTNKTNTSL